MIAGSYREGEVPVTKQDSGRALFTSESVTEGHPDKVADQVSDAVLDAILEQDPYARVSCETAVTTGLVLVMGEISTSCYVDMPGIVRHTIKEIGYTRAKYGFDGDTCAVLTAIDEQSPDIAQGVNRAADGGSEGADSGDLLGAGDQGMMFGFACTETKELMPLPITLSHKLARRLAQVRKDRTLPYLRPDGKSQVTVEYQDDVPVRVDSVVLSAQHSRDISLDQLEQDLHEHVIEPTVSSSLLDEGSQIWINPTGRFVLGGPQADSGMTGRKIIVDTYGGYARHGGGAFSGKDPTKVDRSGAYMARYLAKNLVAAGLASRCEIQLAYAIGVAQPTCVFVDTYGTGVLPDQQLASLIEKNYDLRPGPIIRQLDLRRPIYLPTSVYGHFGRDDLGVPWERVDQAATLKRLAGLPID